MSRRLRIGIDAHAIGPGGTGNARFIAGVITQLQRTNEHDLVLYFTSAASARTWPQPSGTTIRVVRPAHPVLRVPIGMPRAAGRDSLDVLLVQYSATRKVPCPVVSVVHDVSFAAHPEFFSRPERMWMPRTIPATMRRASAILTVSEFSKAEIARLFPEIPADRIHVAHDAPDPALAPTLSPGSTDSSAIPVEPPFFLAIGTVERRKNLGVAIRGLAVVRTRGVRERLVVVGKDGYGAAPIHRTGENAGGVEFLGYVPDGQIAALLSRATALVYPSRYEGFGLPVVEAMAAGVPALVADIPVMREIGADAAVRVPVDDAHAWAAALGRVANDPAYRAGAVERSIARARDFSWEATAGVVRRVLEDAAVS